MKEKEIICDCGRNDWFHSLENAHYQKVNVDGQQKYLMLSIK